MLSFPDIQHQNFYNQLRIGIQPQLFFCYLDPFYKLLSEIYYNPGHLFNSSWKSILVVSLSQPPSPAANHATS